jgi:hypothetical protein
MPISVDTPTDSTAGAWAAARAGRATAMATAARIAPAVRLGRALILAVPTMDGGRLQTGCHIAARLFSGSRRGNLNDI